MSDEIKIGDVCEIIDHPSIVHREFIGAQCTVVSWLLQKDHVGHDCRVSLGDGLVIRAARFVLRKRRPPPVREPVSTWDDVVVWRPKELSHV